jgi:hypothetical protein
LYIYIYTHKIPAETRCHQILTFSPPGGLIYVLYETPQQRLAGELALNGAWFEGKKITATGALRFGFGDLKNRGFTPQIAIYLDTKK